MADYFDILPPALWMLAFLIAFAGGVIKGVVGFAMPMVIISGLGSFLSPELAMAGLIVPTLVTNMMQAFRSGVRSAFAALTRFKRFLIAGGLTMLLGAQLVTALPAHIYFLIIGVPIIAYVISQFAGWTVSEMEQSAKSDIAFGSITGILGGFSGVWGAPTVAYLTALNTQKQTQIQVQGVVFGLGAFLLLIAHFGSGVLNKSTIWLSLGMTAPAILGMAAGTVIQDRINQTVFRRMTLLVLLLAGMNLVRRGLMN